MKITFLIRSLVKGGGAEMQLAYLAKGLRQKGHKVDIICYYRGDSLEQEVAAQGINIHLLNKKNKWDTHKFLVKLYKQIKIIQPDIVYSFLDTSNFFAACVKCVMWRQFKLIWGIRNSSHRTDYTTKTSYLLSILNVWLAKFIPNTIIANSFNGRLAYINRGYPSKKMLVITNGIDIEKFKPNTSSRKRVREKLAIAKHEIVIGMISRLSKRYDIFLMMAAMLLRQNSNLKFILVGDGSEKQLAKLRKLIDKLQLGDNFIFFKSYEPIAELYQMMNIFVLISDSEGFPNVIGEAMASAVPCIATDVGDNKQIIADTGFIIPEITEKVVADVCNDVLSSACKTNKGQAARQRISTEYSVQTLIDKHQAIFTRLMQCEKVGNITHV